MQTLHVNEYDMAYLEVGRGPPLVCVHGTLGDFRTWSAVFGPLSKTHRVISVSLRHFFPEHWDGLSDDYSIAQHVADMIAFIERLDAGPVDLMGHSRGGHIAFRVAQRRPDLLRRLVLAEPGGECDASLDPAATPGPSPLAVRIAAAAGKVGAGDIEGGLMLFFDGIEGTGAWARLLAAPRQQLRDNAFTLLGQTRDKRPPFSRADCAIDRDADAVHRRRRHQGHAAAGAAHTGGASCQFKDDDDLRRRPLDVRSGAGEVLRDRARFFGGVMAILRQAAAQRRHIEMPRAGW
jgi:pimeloyl-ACP methyl ester carboxylesterase